MTYHFKLFASINNESHFTNLRFLKRDSSQFIFIECVSFLDRKSGWGAMDGKRLFIDCNPSKFVVFSSLFMFAILLSLKLGKSSFLTSKSYVIWRWNHWLVAVVCSNSAMGVESRRTTRWASGLAFLCQKSPNFPRSYCRIQGNDNRSFYPLISSIFRALSLLSGQSKPNSIFYFDFRSKSPHHTITNGCLHLCLFSSCVHWPWRRAFGGLKTIGHLKWRPLLPQTFCYLFSSHSNSTE